MSFALHSPVTGVVIDIRRMTNSYFCRALRDLLDPRGRLDPEAPQGAPPDQEVGMEKREKQVPRDPQGSEAPLGPLDHLVKIEREMWRHQMKQNSMKVSITKSGKLS